MNDEAQAYQGLRITIRGIVQGVGFRPFIFTLATRRNLRGWVLNSSKGVEIEVIGEPASLNGFLTDIPLLKPPLSRIDEIKSEPFIPTDKYDDFKIVNSKASPDDFIPISPDVSICEDCTKELFDPSNHRYRYPFINCTNCGPRFTIIQNIPYDRPFTTMSGFLMCSTCHHEYDDPTNRRFHAQPIACPICGPNVWLEVEGNIIARNDQAIVEARSWLTEGKILAVKGLGGYHLACDAESLTAVDNLRKRKKRIQKPFALMSYSLDIIRKHCEINEVEKQLLLGREKPIVLLRKLPKSTIVESVAPSQLDLGFMLPYTPLHLLLLEPKKGFPEVFVMTSGNISEEPISYEDGDARTRLLGLADAFLVHNRRINTRLDDSVVRVFSNSIYPIRRSRGYAPDPILLKQDVKQVFAAGADLKNTFCFTRGRYAFMSHHIGDLENYSTNKAYEENIKHYQRIFRIEPTAVACDLHPEYYSTKFAEEYAGKHNNIPLVKIQHHHAHLASCLADNHWSSTDPVICFSFDGTGYGTDGAIWGGEVFLGGYAGYQRISHLDYFALPGGDMAIRKPSKIALSLLSSLDFPWEKFPLLTNATTPGELDALQYQLRHHVNIVPTSSMGRLFDAISSLLNICHTVTYEGQAAIELEAFCDQSEESFYHFDICENSFSPHTLLIELLQDLFKGKSTQQIAAKFHNGVVSLILSLSNKIRQDTGIKTIALSGGVWQNQYLLNRAFKTLCANDFSVLTHHVVPTNDGGIALGQALLAHTFLSK